MTHRHQHQPAVGDQLGNLEYTIGDGDLRQYRRLVGADGHYPNLLADDCRALLKQRVGDEPLTTVWQRLDFMRPPVPGRRVQVGGWLRDLGESNGRPFFRVASFAVDDIGTEIMRAEAAFVLGEQERDWAITRGIPTYEADAYVGRLAGALPGERVGLGKLALEGGTAARQETGIGGGWERSGFGEGGTAPTVMMCGWLEAMMGREFGYDFRWGGRISLAFHGSQVPAGILRADAVVMGRDMGADGVVTSNIVASVWGASESRSATAHVLIKAPSPRLL